MAGPLSAVVSMPSQLFTMPNRFGAVLNGSIYIGEVDTDPTQPENQIPVYVENDEGVAVQVSQPIKINGGGYPSYNGAIKKFTTSQGHSMAVVDSLGVQQFYFGNVLKYNPNQDISQFKESLASTSVSSPGSDLIGLPNGVNLTSYLSTGRGIDPWMPPYNYRSSDSLAARTSALQRAFSDANDTKKCVFFSGFYEIDSLSISDHSDYSVEGFGGIVAKGDGEAGKFCLEMKNCLNVNFNGNISVNGKAGFDGVVKVWSDKPSGTSRMQLRINVIGGAIGWQFGDLSRPDTLVSEIRVLSSQTYNVREVVRIIGSQTVIEFNGCQMVATDGDIGNNVVGVATLFGGALRINGGEVMMPSSPNGLMFNSYPIDSQSFTKAYGIVTITGAPIECAGIWFIAYNRYNVQNVNYNPDTKTYDRTGAFILSACTGYTPYDNPNIQLDGQFNGKISVDNGCWFHRHGAKPNVIVTCSANSNPLIMISRSAFDSNFPSGLSAINGGVPLFNFRRIVQVSSVGALSLPTGSTTDLVFKNKSAAGDNAYFGQYYNNAQGTFTVPVGGLRSVRFHMEISFSQAMAGGSIQALVDGAIVSVCGTSSPRVNADFDLGDLVAGNVVKFRLYNPNAAVTTSDSNLDFMTVSAER